MSFFNKICGCELACSWSTASSAMVDAAPGALGSPDTEMRTPPPAAPEIRKSTISSLMPNRVS